MYLREGGKVVIHRIYRRKKDGFIMLGDGQTKKEPGVRKEQVVAIVSRRIRGEKVTRCDTAIFRLRAVLEMHTRPWRRTFWRLAAPMYRKIKAVFTRKK